MASLQDIADYVGVSKATVSIYLKDKNTSRVGVSTKKKIDEARKKFNYRPNNIARSLSTKKSMSIGIMVPFNGSLYQSTFINELLSGIQSVLFPRQYSMVFLPTTGEDSRSMVKNQLDKGQGHDGLILFGTRYCTTEDMESNVQELEKSGMPFVVVNMPQMKSVVNQVVFRDPPSANPVKYLIELGHERILLMAGREQDSESLASILVYKETCLERDIPFDDDLVLWGDFEKDSAKSSLIQYLTRKKLDFTAVYCLSDTMALGVYEALKEHNISVPGDISVIGRNDSFFASYMAPPLTTVKRQVFNEGKKAAEILLNTIETGRTGQFVILDSSLSLRDSTRALLNM
ncbi:MAG: LacI family DNA-binding transcriptional regulator [Spirochaetales bacterium]|nr:LacI family DNA-binding transcriptional regulator [Spirochaetales bacterium]